MKKYELIKIIGDGTYGIVYEGRNKETNQKVAIKKLKERFKSLEECLSRIEVKVLEKLNHENIVQLKEVIRDKKGEVSYIFEYCDCNLFEFIENHREHKKIIPEPIIREIVLQLTKGMKYMHSKQYFHRDLKPENILLTLNKYNLNNMVTGELKLKICDFGTAKEIPIKNILPMTDYVCIRWYRPPECILRGDYDEKMDIWAIGCIMAELYNLGAIFPGENEFDQINQILKILGTPTRTKWPWGYYQSELFGIQLPVYYKKDLKKILGYISKEGVNLLNEIFTFDPTKRPSCCKILNHQYFKVIPKPKININSNSLRTSHKKNNLTVDNKNDMNNRTNNNSKAKIEINNNNNKLKNITINNNEKKIISKRISNNDLIENYLNNTIKNENAINDNNFNNKIKKNNIENINYLSTTEKKMKYNNKYVKINETKSGIVTKKILKYNKNNKENKENKMNNNNKDKKELNIRRIERIGRNEDNYITFNNIKKLSFIQNSKTEDKENIRDKSSDYITNLRNRISSNKKSMIKNKEESKQNINPDIKKYKNYKIVDIVYNNNHKDHYIKYNKTNVSTNRRNVINKSNTKIIISRKSNERNSENNNNKLLLRTKNLNLYNNNSKNNHKFYISKGNKHNNTNNQKYIICSDNYRTYNEVPNHNHNNLCICTLGRNYSTKKNIINNNNNEYRHTNKNSYNIRRLDNCYKNNNITPKNNKNNNYKSYKKSPIKKEDKISSLFTYFISSKNNIKPLFEKSQSLIKNNNNSSVNINFKNGYKREHNNINNNDKKRVKIMNVEISDENGNNNNYYKDKNYIHNSTSKKNYYRNTKN